jgi:hypothetical protein
VLGCAVGGQEMASLLTVDVMNLLVRTCYECMFPCMFTSGVCVDCGRHELADVASFTNMFPCMFTSDVW